MILSLSGCSLSSSHSKKSRSSRYASSLKKYSSSGRTWRPTRKNSIPVVMNARVKKWVRAFNGPLKPSFSRWIKRIGQYGSMIEDVLVTENAPKDLIYLAMIESGFNMKARSHASAVGPWQFIRSTGNMYGLNAGVFVDERKDIIQATEAAARHLRDLYKIYGDWYLAFSAYNAGPGKTNRAIRRGRSKNYWALSGRRSRLFRQETKDYVPKILAALHIVKNYKKYGYNEKSFGQPLDYDRVTVPDATDVAIIAKSAGTSVKHIQALNPNLNLGITPPGQRFSIYVPQGAKDEFLRNYAKVPASRRVSNLQYVTGSKETIAQIAKRYSLSASRIARLNGKKTNQRLKYGTVIKIPASKSSLVAMAKGGAYGRSGSKSRMVYHKVRPGDTLSRIARKHKTSVKKVAKWNKLNRRSKLRVGRKLKIYKKSNGRKSGGRFKVASTSRGRKRMSGVNHIINQDQQNPVKVIDAHSNKINIPKMAAVADDTLEDFKNQPALVKTLQGDLVGDDSKKTAPKVATLKPVSSKKSKPRYHTVKKGDTLSGIARRYRISMKQIKSLNGMKSNKVRLKQRLLVKGSRNSRTVPTVATKPPAPKKVYYTVRSNDSLLRIAKNNGTSVSQIKSLNSLKSNTIRVGQKLLIKSSQPSAVVVARQTPTATRSSNSVYVVKPKDSLSGIAVKHRVRVSDIKSWNNLKSNHIRAGQKLRILKGQKARIVKAPTKNKSNRVIYHRIKSGETLWSLSKKYQVKISDIMRWNNMKNDQVRPKQKIKIIATRTASSYPNT